MEYMEVGVCQKNSGGKWGERGGRKAKCSCELYQKYGWCRHCNILLSLQNPQILEKVLLGYEVSIVNGYVLYVECTQENHMKPINHIRFRRQCSMEHGGYFGNGETNPAEDILLQPAKKSA
jgi:hypothetical protein